MPESSANSSTADTSEIPTIKVEQIPVESIPEETAKTSTVEDIGYLPLQDFLGISTVDDGQKEKLQYIWNSFAKGRDRADTLQAIKEARHTLSPPDIGENYLHKLYAYTRLIEDSRSIQKEIKAYKNEG